MNDKKNKVPAAAEVSFAAEREEIKSRKFKYGTMAVLTSVIFIAAVVTVNIFIGYLTARFVLEFDMTAEKLFDIGDDTKEIIADLSEPITITVLSEETTFKNGQNMSANIAEILQRYEALAAGMITVRYLDPLINIGEAERLKQHVGNSLVINDIVIESSKRMKRLSPQSLYTYRQQNYNGAVVQTGNTSTEYFIGLRAEQRLSSALLFVTSDEVSKAAWIWGHQETYQIPEFETLLAFANYDVISIQLISEEIPDDVTMLIISGPETDYTTDEIAKLSAFLERGGDMIVAMSPYGVNHPNLDLLFEEWGIKYTRDIVYDSLQNISGIFEYIIPNIEVYESITGNLPRQEVVMGGSRPILITNTQASAITVTPLLTSSLTSYAKRHEDVGRFTAKNPERDTDGPFNVSVLSERLISDKNQFYTRSSILFTNLGFLTQSFLIQPAFLNRTYIGNVLSYVSDNTEGIIIPDKNFISKILTITGGQTQAVLFIVVLGMPALLTAIGIIVWARRRHL